MWRLCTHLFKAANRFIFNRSDVVSAIGAFVTGVLGNAYARVFRATAFTAMVTAVSFLVPVSGKALSVKFACFWRDLLGVI